MALTDYFSLKLWLSAQVCADPRHTHRNKRTLQKTKFVCIHLCKVFVCVEWQYTGNWADFRGSRPESKLRRLESCSVSPGPTPAPTPAPILNSADWSRASATDELTSYFVTRTLKQFLSLPSKDNMLTGPVPCSPKAPFLRRRVLPACPDISGLEFMLRGRVVLCSRLTSAKKENHRRGVGGIVCCETLSDH